MKEALTHNPLILRVGGRSTPIANKSTIRAKISHHDGNQVFHRIKYYSLSLLCKKDMKKREKLLGIQLIFNSRELLANICAVFLLPGDLPRAGKQRGKERSKQKLLFKM